jgi:hypothetical protein
VSEDRNQAAHAAVSDLVQQIDPGAMVTRFVLLAEVIDAENDRALWSFVAPRATKWDTLGLLEFARVLEYGDREDL